MDNLAGTSSLTPVTQIQVQSGGAITAVTPVSSVTNLTGVAALPNVGQIVAGALPTISQVWYNCGVDGMPQIMSANPQSVVEINTADLARQFNQQVQTPYGNIQVQVQPVPSQIIPNKQPVEETDDDPLDLLDKSEGKNRVRVGGGGKERVPCPTCGKTVSCNATLRDHMRTHTGERPFVCSECGLAFAQRSNLRMHKRLHTGERPYMCGVCGKTFARSSHLPAHMRTHTGEKPYSCPKCNHSFITTQQLKNHFRVHTGEKPWKCDMCTAAFTHSSSLSTHKKKHAGRKPFECVKCQKTFFFASALDKHMKVHTKIRPFNCDECDKAFKYKESLTVHKDKYCGRELSKRPRAPRRPDARKPGPKPGSGRKYIQKRRGRPRGRPRKKPRFGPRGRLKKNFEGELEDSDQEIAENVERGPSPFTEEELTFKKPYPDVEDDPDEVDSPNNVPTAELKVEVITPEESELVNLNRTHRETFIDNDQSLPQSTGHHSSVEQALSRDMLQIQSAQEIQLDDTTALTIVSADDTEQQVAAAAAASGSGVQLVTLAPGVPLQFVQQEGEDGQVTHQLITRDGIPMWFNRQFQ